MIIKSIKDGGVLYGDDFISYKRTIEQAVKENINLAYADLRKLDLRGANLEGGNFIHACFWGSDLSGSDTADSNFHHADFRLCQFERTCLADSILTHCDMRGAYFENIIWDGCDISHSRFSCPSILRQDFKQLRDMRDIFYHHLGEMDVVFSAPPIRMTGLDQDIIVFDHHVMIGSDFYKYGEETSHYRPLIAMLYNHKNKIKRLKHA